MQTPALSLVVLLVLGCASSSAGEGEATGIGTPERVAYVDYRSNRTLELVNESHTGRVEQYSEIRKNADRKVQTDDVLSGLIEFMREEGFERLARPGPAPQSSDGQVALALEIEHGDRIEHVLGFKGMPPKDHESVLTLWRGFLEIYNATFGLQAVESPADDLPFENPVGTTRRKPPKVPEQPN